MSGIAIVVVFLLLAGLMVARKLPALLAVPLMAIAMAALAGNAPAAVADVIVRGAVQLAPVYATVVAGTTTELMSWVRSRPVIRPRSSSISAGKSPVSAWTAARISVMSVSRSGPGGDDLRTTPDSELVTDSYKASESKGRPCGNPPSRGTKRS